MNKSRNIVLILINNNEWSGILLHGIINYMRLVSGP